MPVQSNVRGTGARIALEGGGGGGGSGPTNLAYDPATRALTSDTGADVTLPLADGAVDGLLASADYDFLQEPNLRSIAAISAAAGYVIVHNGVNWVGLPGGTTGQVLTGSTNEAPAWATPVAELPVGTRGSLLEFNGTSWVNLAPGTAGRVLTTQGAGADPTWTALPTELPSGTRGNVLFFNGTSWVGLPPGTAGNVLVTNGAGADPSWATPGTGATLPGGAQGNVLYHNGTNWAALAPGTDGHVLTTKGTNANPVWQAAPGGSTLPAGAAGNVLVHNGTAWIALTPGTSGQYLRTNGVGATPTWNTIPSGGSPVPTFEVKIASHEARDADKLAADGVCGSTNAQVVINEAILEAAALQTRSGIPEGMQRGKVLLSGGQYPCNGSVLGETGVVLEGMGQLTELLDNNITTATGSGTELAVVKLRNGSVHLFRLSNLWINGGAAGGGNGSGIAFVGSSGDSLSAYPDTDPDPDCVINGVYVFNMLGGSAGQRHGIIVKTDMRGTRIFDCDIRRMSGHGIWFDGAPDSHVSNIHIGGCTGDGFRIDGGNLKLSNLKAYYCDGSGFNLLNSRCVGATLEAQDCVVGFTIGAPDCTWENLLVDTCQNDGILMTSSADRTWVSGNVLHRTSGRYAAMARGVTFQSGITGSKGSVIVNSAGITAPRSGTIPPRATNRWEVYNGSAWEESV